MADDGLHLNKSTIMTFLELCEKRYSVRKYTDEPVSEEDLAYVLKCTQLAPSAVNFQPWKFVVVESEEAKEKLRQCYSRDWFNSAPMYIIAYRNKKEEWVRKVDQKPHGDIDVSIAVEHICMAATEQGLGSCWVCNFDAARLHELLGLEPDEEASVIVPIGHPAAELEVPEKKRKEREAIISEL